MRELQLSCPGRLVTPIEKGEPQAQDTGLSIGAIYSPLMREAGRGKWETDWILAAK